jgi:hypothetical protein
LQCLGIWFFMLFMIRFLETKRDFPFLHKLYMIISGKMPWKTISQRTFCS